MTAPHDATSNPARKCVLVVEDNALTMNLFTAMITAEGYEVLQAVDGCHALDLAHRWHPDLIIMDLQLPDMSGLDVTHTLKEADDTHAIPIIATATEVAEGGESAIRASGCDSYMQKPIAISEFLDLVEKLMRRRSPEPALG